MKKTETFGRDECYSDGAFSSGLTMPTRSPYDGNGSCDRGDDGEGRQHVIITVSQ